ncbi:hypothetical protein Nmel_014408, partial [Mimus melanotis]
QNSSTNKYKIHLWKLPRGISSKSAGAAALAGCRAGNELSWQEPSGDLKEQINLSRIDVIFEEAALAWNTCD